MYCAVLCSLTSVMSESLRPYELQPTRLPCPYNFPNKNIGVGCHVLLQSIFLTQRSNLPLLWLLHCRWILYHWVTREELKVYENSFIGKGLENWLSHVWLGLVLYQSERVHPLPYSLTQLVNTFPFLYSKYLPYMVWSSYGSKVDPYCLV